MMFPLSVALVLVCYGILVQPTGANLLDHLPEEIRHNFKTCTVMLGRSCKKLETYFLVYKKGPIKLCCTNKKPKKDESPPTFYDNFMGIFFSGTKKNRPTEEKKRTFFDNFKDKFF